MPYIGVRRQFFVVVVILPYLKHTFSILITFNANRALKTLHLGPLTYTKGGPGSQMLLIIISKGFFHCTLENRSSYSITVSDSYIYMYKQERVKNLATVVNVQ